MADSESIQTAESAPATETGAAMPPQPERRGDEAASSSAPAALSVEHEPEVDRSSATTGASVVDLKRVRSIKVLVQAVLGGINMPVSRLSELKEGEIVQLDTRIGDPIDILTNGQLMARGEIVVIEGPENKFGIQITSLEPQGNA